MKQLADNLWTWERDAAIAGVRLGGRMTAVRLEDGGLLLHSPIELTDELADELAGLGPIRHLVAPNTFHHLHVAPYLARWPGARAYGAPGLAKKRKDLSFAGVLSDTPEAAWAAELDQHLVGGIPSVNEIVLLHSASRTLITCDLVFNIRAAVGWYSAMYLKMAGVHQRLGVSRLLRMFMKDKAAVRRSVDTLLGWDFDRLTMTHGQVVETGAKDALRAAFDWLPAVGE